MEAVTVMIRTLGTGVEVTAAMGALSVLGGGGMYAYKDFEWARRRRVRRRNKKEMKRITEDDALNHLFHTLYYKEISEGDEFIQSMWRRIFGSTKQMLNTVGLSDCESVGVWREGEE